MGLLDNIFETEPDFINGKGVKWWLDKESTQYAIRENHNGISLPNVRIFMVEEPDGNRTRVITENQAVVYDSQKLEDIAVHIDIMKLDQQNYEEPWTDED